jgi:ABC-type multidrug transport system fused ATPase/permease subunit
LLRWGALLQHHDGLRIQHLQQGLGSVKDVKLLGREDDFLQQYWKHNLGSAEIGKRQDALSALPRLWLEFLAVIGLTLLTYGIIWQGKPVENLVPTLGLFAAAAFRLMPSGSRVIGAVQSVHYSLPVIESLTEAFKEFERMPSEEDLGKQQFRRELNIENLRFRYDGAAKESIRGVSLTIPSGSSVGFIGSSGAGKSTLVDLILGLLEPTSGVVKVDGCDIQKNLRAWQDQIGYVVNAIRGAQLEDFVRDLPDGLDTLVGERGVRLSGGQRQRIGIARALYHDPAILILDEATSSLDSATEKGVMKAVRALQGKKTVLIVAHRLSTVEYCSRLYRLEQGEIVDEGAANLVLKRVASF